MFLPSFNATIKVVYKAVNNDCIHNQPNTVLHLLHTVVGIGQRFATAVDLDRVER